MKFETARIQVPSDVFAAVFVVLVSQAPYYLSVWEKRVQFSVHVHVEIQIHWRYAGGQGLERTQQCPLCLDPPCSPTHGYLGYRTLETNQPGNGAVT